MSMEDLWLRQSVYGWVLFLGIKSIYTTKVKEITETSASVGLLLATAVICVNSRDVFYYTWFHGYIWARISLHIFQQSWMTSFSMQFHAKNKSIGKVSLNRIFPGKEIYRKEHLSI